MLPTLWFRNTWSWGDAVAKPAIAALDGPPGLAAARVTHDDLGEWLFCADASATLLFCENETNNQRLFGAPNASPYPKDGINDFVVEGAAGAVNPDRTGTKVAAQHVLELAPGQSAQIRVRLTAGAKLAADPLAAPFDHVLSARKAEADKFYATVIPPALTADQALVMRQALAGLLWGKQYYEYDVHRWLREHGVDPWGPNAPTSGVRNVQWFHMLAGDIISMPDKWEYPWFAAWDLAFHCAPLSLVDIDFAKEQVELLLKTRYLHPNGQIPAYEWNFGDVNPPVTPWAALYVYEREAEIRGEGDHVFLARVFDRLLTNFTWWVNRKDPDDRNLFQGGFLGLDNIGIFDRSAPLPGGGQLEQADGTAWMALYCQWMLQIAIELSREQPAYIDMALKFIAHFTWISVAMNPPEGDSTLWDDHDGFYYDVMRMPDGSTIELKVRSLVGLLPMCAATVFEPDVLDRFPLILDLLGQMIERFEDSLPQLAHLPGPSPEGRRITSAGRRDSPAPDPLGHARRGRVPWASRDPGDLAPSPRAARRVRLGRPGVQRPLPARRVRHRDVRRQLQLARAGVVPDEPGDPPRADPAPPVLRRPREGRVPDRLGPRAEPGRGRRRDRGPPHDHVHRRRERTPAGVRRDRDVPDRPSTGMT